MTVAGRTPNGMDELTARLLSVAIEAPVALLWIAAVRWPVRGGPLAAAGVAAFATLASHPLAWPAMLALMPALGYAPSVALVEAAVTVAEAAAYAGILALGPLRALALSALANGASLGTGLLLHVLMAG